MVCAPAKDPLNQMHFNALHQSAPLTLPLSPSGGEGEEERFACQVVRWFDRYLPMYQYSPANAMIRNAKKRAI